MCTMQPVGEVVLPCFEGMQLKACMRETGQTAKVWSAACACVRDNAGYSWKKCSLQPQVSCQGLGSGAPECSIAHQKLPSQAQEKHGIQDWPLACRQRICTYAGMALSCCVSAAAAFSRPAAGVPSFCKDHKTGVTPAFKVDSAEAALASIDTAQSLLRNSGMEDTCACCCWASGRHARPGALHRCHLMIW